MHKRLSIFVRLIQKDGGNRPNDVLASRIFRSANTYLPAGRADKCKALSGANTSPACIFLEKYLL